MLPPFIAAVRAALAERDSSHKCALTDALAEPVTLDPEWPVDARGIPGRPDLPTLVAPHRVPQRKGKAGHAPLIHAIAHIEFNAINLALDAIWRFPGLPLAYYCDWLTVAKEEAIHFRLLTNHLLRLGHRYGDFPAHDGLWEMAEKTRHDPLARLALVPRTLEARGLDASPAIRDRLKRAGDIAGATIISRILSDEVGHVAIGNHWYRMLCAERGADPLLTYQRLTHAFEAPVPRGPINLEARRQAGFTEAELLWLTCSATCEGARGDAR